MINGVFQRSDLTLDLEKSKEKTIALTGLSVFITDFKNKITKSEFMTYFIVSSCEFFLQTKTIDVEIPDNETLL